MFGEAVVVRRVGDVALGVAVAAAAFTVAARFALFTLARGLVLAGLGSGGRTLGAFRPFAALRLFGALNTLGTLYWGGFGFGGGTLDPHGGLHRGAFAMVLHLTRAMVTLAAAAAVAAAS